MQTTFIGLFLIQGRLTPLDENLDVGGFSRTKSVHCFGDIVLLLRVTGLAEKQMHTIKFNVSRVNIFSSCLVFVDGL